MQIVTIDQLGAIIEAQQGAQPCTLTTRTDAKLLKTGNPFGEVVKYSKVNAFVGVNYENSVNNQRLREDSETDFVAQAPKWGNRVGKKLIAHKGALYAPVKIGKALQSPRYVSVTGEQLTSEQVTPFKPAEKSNSEAQGVDKEIVWRTYKLENILKMTVGGETYIVTGTPAVQALHRELPAEQVAEIEEVLTN